MTNEFNKESDVVLAGRILAASASAGISRNSGRDYYSHPHEVAQILRVASGRTRHLKPEELDVLLFLAYCHDAFEDTFKNGKGSFLETDIVVSPLLVKKYLESCESPDASRVANTLMLLSKPIGPDGKMPYLSYIQRGLHDSGFIITKLADMQHNLEIEPKVAYSDGAEVTSVLQKHREYREARSILLESANTNLSFNSLIMAHAITVITKRDVHSVREHPNAAIPHDFLAQRFKANVALARKSTLGLGT
jgi:hypothetical protein